MYKSYPLVVFVFLPVFLFAQNGNIGIGKKNPKEKLHVAGNLRVDSLAGTNERMVSVDASGTLKAQIPSNVIQLYDESDKLSIELLPDPVSVKVLHKDSIIFSVSVKEAADLQGQFNINPRINSDTPPPLTGDVKSYIVGETEISSGSNGSDYFSSNLNHELYERKQSDGSTKYWQYIDNKLYSIYVLDSNGKKTVLNRAGKTLRQDVYSPDAESETTYQDEDNSLKINNAGLWISTPTFSNDITSDKIELTGSDATVTVDVLNDNQTNPGFHMHYDDGNIGTSMGLNDDGSGNNYAGFKAWGNDNSSSTISPAAISLESTFSLLSQTSKDISIMGSDQNVELNQTGLWAYSKDYSKTSGFQFTAGGTTTHTGNFHVTGNTSTDGTKSFKIDHPLDPENKYLYHFSIESDEVLNQYSGNVITDENGYATIELPNYFESLNKDFRYQLTAIESFSRAMISKKINNNRFEIRTEEPNTEVSWMVTAIRNDKYIKDNPPRSVVDKSVH